ncbi:pyridoxamine 5-phosphate oxidase [Alphaproteobacteria bacterium GH1-50]|uniref:Pyridoxamine 5-phosphate oxidase n=1 Tax=Kangsaoukella pontilimi TaxID=2691042 RepID=A0A7C9MFU5_9RHOB|nr:pyridoxamine 5'-phosphate oxidase family protein [Kangsaoukella pontilimi]MXQ09112.1 pyridoxamine 5-phosphate oxidase [Kangsaoukella pontilimi]
MTKKDPIRPTDDEARALARRLLTEARHGALATLRDGQPHVTRVALAIDGADLLTLVSDLAPHTAAIRNHPQVSILLGEPGRGDPLAHPRMTVMATAEFADKQSLKDTYLKGHPKAALYVDFADFHIVRLKVTAAELNGGFGKAYRLTKEELNI